VVMKTTVFWDTTPCSALKVNGSFGGKYRFHLQGRRISSARYQRESLSPDFTIVSCFAYPPNLKMKTTCSSETSVDFQRTTRCYIAEASTFQSRVLLPGDRNPFIHLTENRVGLRVSLGTVDMRKMIPVPRIELRPTKYILPKVLYHVSNVFISWRALIFCHWWLIDFWLSCYPVHQYLKT
jgi:hypothetical protein